MRRPVLAQPDRVVGEHVDHRQSAERRQADRRPHVVRKDQERGADGADAPVEREAVQHRAHGVFAHAEMHVPGPPVSRCHVAALREHHVRRRREIGGAAHQLGDRQGERREHPARRRPCGLRLSAGERRQPRLPALAEPARPAALELRGELGISLAVGLVARLPLGFEPGAPLAGATPVRQRRLRHVKWLETGPAEPLFRELHLGLAQRRAVRLG